MINNEINTDFYSRQIGTYGLELIRELMKIKILIIGLRGLGMEIAKNIILCGPNEVSLFDKNIITHFDLGSGFYFKEEQINKIQRDKGCIKKLSQLNPYVNVNVLEDDLLLSIKKYNIIIITEFIEIDLLNSINEICAKKKIGLIYGAVLGLISFIFVDFGEEHKIINKDGRPLKKFYITNISNETNALVTIDPESIQTSSFNDGDLVKFKEIEGMNELNGQIRKVEIKTSTEFYIEEDTSDFNKYIKGGIAEEYKISIKKNYSRFKDSINQPKCEEYFYEDGKNTIRHSIIYAIHEFYKENSRLTELNNEEDSQIILQKAKYFFEEKKKTNEWFKESNEEFDEEMVLNLAKWSKAELSPICNFIGGIMAQEAIKYTGKYTPLDQWAWFDFYDTIKGLNVKNRKLKNTRYDEQIAIYGNEIQNKLSKINLFLIGAGALGCEYLKIFSMMGIATDNDSKVTLTDNDNIEISNLNRQFLFRKEHTGKSKSECACKAIKEINKDFNCEYQNNLVNINTENIYTEDFWRKQDFIINAVDNVEARKYIDSQCTLFNLNLIDSGTEGIKASTQLIIPKITMSYNETNSISLKKEIPICTLRQFPSIIEHCIEWGKNKFEELFYQDILFLKEFLMDPLTNIQNISEEFEESKLEKIKKIYKLLTLIESKDINKIINDAISIFMIDFNYNIKKITKIYPQDYKNENGQFFWIGAKRFPISLDFNIKDNLIYSFISSYTKIFCHILKIPFSNEDIDKKIEIITHFEKLSIEESNFQKLKNDVDNLLKNFIINTEFQPEIFEKDNDDNNHINFIHACANLRARNYRLDECDKIQTKLISGNIIPAVSTSTASVTGFAATQIYTLLYTNNIEYLNEILINLSVNVFYISKPKIVKPKTDFQGRNKKIIAIPPNWTIWDHIEIKGPIKIQELFNYVEKEYKVIIKGMYTFDKRPLITNRDMLQYNIEKAFSLTLKKEINELRRILTFTVDGKNLNKNNVIMPVFMYKF